MFSQSLSDIRRQLIDIPGLFNPSKHEGFLIVALERTIKQVDTDRLGYDKTVVLNSVRRRITLPIDCIGITSINGYPPHTLAKTMSRTELKVAGDGPFTIVYKGLDLDQEGVPMIHDTIKEALLKMIDYLIVKSNFDSAVGLNASLRTIGLREVKIYEADAIGACQEARGELNMMGVGEMMEIANERTSGSYRNR